MLRKSQLATCTCHQLHAGTSCVSLSAVSVCLPAQPSGASIVGERLVSPTGLSFAVFNVQMVCAVFDVLLV